MYEKLYGGNLSGHNNIIVNWALVSNAKPLYQWKESTDSITYVGALYSLLVTIFGSFGNGFYAWATRLIAGGARGPPMLYSPSHVLKQLPHWSIQLLLSMTAHFLDLTLCTFNKTTAWCKHNFYVHWEIKKCVQFALLWYSSTAVTWSWTRISSTPCAREHVHRAQATTAPYSLRESGSRDSGFRGESGAHEQIPAETRRPLCSTCYTASSICTRCSECSEATGDSSG